MVSHQSLLWNPENINADQLLIIQSNSTYIVPTCYVNIVWDATTHVPERQVLQYHSTNICHYFTQAYSSYSSGTVSIPVHRFLCYALLLCIIYKHHLWEDLWVILAAMSKNDKVYAKSNAFTLVSLFPDKVSKWKKTWNTAQNVNYVSALDFFTYYPSRSINAASIEQVSQTHLCGHLMAVLEAIFP